MYLAIHEASKKWTMPIKGWKAALNHFAIVFEGRLRTGQKLLSSSNSRLHRAFLDKD